MTRLDRKYRPFRRGRRMTAVVAVAVLLVCVIVSILWLTPIERETSPKRVPPSPFVQVDGARFVLNGAAYRFVGINFWHGAYLGADIIPSGRARLCRELDLLTASGVTNLRITAASEASAMARSVRPAFQTAPGRYNERLLVGLDVLLDEMGKRNMKAVMVMGNYWEWTGGMAQYVSWITKTPVVDPAAPGQGGAFMAYAAEFYDLREAWRPYFAYAKHVIHRINTINGKSYAKDPTIMSWQLANEPRPHPDGRTDPSRVAGFYDWVRTAAETIHSLAPHQLVSTGNEGTVGSLDKKDIYLNTHRLPAIDYMTFHIWPKNWRWYVPGDTSRTLSNTIEKTLAYIADHVAYARAAGKPTVLEEFGMVRDNGAVAPKTPVTDRNRFLKAIFDAVEADARKDGPLAGTNVWAWGGEGRRHNDSAVWEAGTDFTGDPPQEAQGLNSVFDSDRETLSLLRRHAETLGQLTGRATTNPSGSGEE